MTIMAEDAAELIERLEPDEQEQALRIMRRMADGKHDYRPIDMDEMRTKLEGLCAVTDLLLADIDNESIHVNDCKPSARHAHFTRRTLNLYQPALNHIFFFIQDLYRRAEEATS